MKIVNTHLVFLYRANGPSGSYILEEVVETEDGYFFRRGGRAGTDFFQVKPTEFENAVTYTAKVMPELHVEYSQERKK